MSQDSFHKLFFFQTLIGFKKLMGLPLTVSIVHMTSLPGGQQRETGQYGGRFTTLSICLRFISDFQI